MCCRPPVSGPPGASRGPIGKSAGPTAGDNEPVHTSLTFLGAAGTVTGSKFLIGVGETQVLVDAGLFQGLKALRRRNWDPLGVPATSLDAVVVSHAHLDHCGYLPALVARGFDGTVWVTEGTRRLAEIVLMDAGHLQEREAQKAALDGQAQRFEAERQTLQAAVRRAEASVAEGAGRIAELEGLVRELLAEGEYLSMLNGLVDNDSDWKQLVDKANKTLPEVQE